MENKKQIMDLEHLVYAITEAIVEAQDSVEKHQLKHMFKKYFDEKNKAPHMFIMALPSLDHEGKQSEYKVPLISLVPHSNLIVKEANTPIDVDITFNIEVKSASSERSTEEKKAEAERKIGWGPFSVSVKGSVSSTKENTRSTDNSAKYHVEVHAVDSGMPEGLARVMDILNITIIPDINK